MAAKTGCPELRKVLRRYRGVTLEGGPHPVVCLNGKPLRLPGDGRKLVIPNSPKNPGDAAKLLVQRLRELGVEPRRA